MRFFSFLVAFLFASLLVAQQPPVTKDSSVLVTNVHAHIGNGQFIANAAIGIRNGKIAFVVPMGNALVRPETFDKVVNGMSFHAYPGFIAPNTRLGLEEIEAVRATLDFAEVGQYNPNVRSLIAYNTDSDILPTIRSSGVLLAQICPQGGARITGSSSIVSLESYDNWEERAYRADDGIHLNWPQRIQFLGWWAEPEGIKRSEKYPEQIKEVRAFFTAAKAYHAMQNHEAVNIRFEAMRSVLAQESQLYIHVEDAKSILEALQFAREFSVKPVIVGGTDAWLVADALRAQNVGVILNATHSLPSREDEDIDQPYKTPFLLHQKGVRFCFSLDGSWQQRNLMYQAGQAVGFGLPKEAAVQALTLDAAKLLGIGNEVGSLEPGKDATFILTEGDALDVRFSNVILAWVQGHAAELDDKQKVLYRQYIEKFGLKMD